MAKKTKFDGVVESVHYQPDGQVSWVRVYQKRGPTFSDRILLDRQAFIDQLKAGKKYYSGHRIPLRASTFEIGKQVRLAEKDGHEYLLIGDQQADRDHLEGVPII
jgi:hypothetical protein